MLADHRMWSDPGRRPVAKICGRSGARGIATVDRFEDTVVAFAPMSGVPIDVVEHKLNDGFVEFLLILSKAIGLSWVTTRVVLLMLGVRHQRCATDEVDTGLTAFQQLNRETARRILNVYRIEGAN